MLLQNLRVSGKLCKSQIRTNRFQDVAQVEIKPKILDAFIKDYKNAEDRLGENGFLKQLTKYLLERAIAAELT